MANSRVRRGRKSQDLLAEWFNRHGWGEAEAIAASLPGRDIKGMPDLAPEVKATRGLPGVSALKQAKANAGKDLAFVIYRPPGYGEARIAEWLVSLDLDDFTQLLLAAGY